jgi:hypothetical protein
MAKVPQPARLDDVNDTAARVEGVTRGGDAFLAVRSWRIHTARSSVSAPKAQISRAAVIVPVGSRRLGAQRLL